VPFGKVGKGVTYDLDKKDERNALANFLVTNQIAPSMEAKGNLPMLWKVNEAIQRNEKGCSGQQDIAPNYKPFHVPFVQPRVDIISGALYQRFTSVTPIVQCVPIGDDTSLDQAEAMEGVLQTVLERADLDTQIPLGIQTTCTCGVVVFRVCPDEEIKELKLSTIHPNDFAIYPSTAKCVKDSAGCGHRFWLMADEIPDMADFEVEAMTGHFLEPGEQSGSPLIPRKDNESGVVLTGDMPVECWEWFVRMDIGQGRKLYKAWVTRDLPRLLKFEETDLPRPWYFEGRLHVEWGGFWPEGSIGQNLQGMQHLYTDLHNALVAGSYASMSPRCVIGGGAIADKVRKMGFGDIYEASGPVNVSVIPSSFNPGVLPQMIQEVDSKGDAIARVSRISQNRQLKGRTTATEAEMIQGQGDDAMVQYAAHFSRTLSDIASFVCDFLKKHPDYLAMVYPEHAKDEVPVTAGTYRYEVTGRTQSNLPDTQVKKFGFALETAFRINEENQKFGAPPTYDTAAIADAMLTVSQLPIKLEKVKFNGKLGQQPPPMAGAMGQPGMEGGPETMGGEAGGMQPPPPQSFATL